MKVTLWGTRGSLATPGPATQRYGGNTACVEVRGNDGELLVLDAGTGIRGLGATVEPESRRVDILLTHLHMDHIQGLGFFDPLYVPGLEVHIWGPPSTTMRLHERLSRYLSPPLFPVRLRELPCDLTLHDVPLGEFGVGSLKMRASLICHPGPTVGYRISENGSTVAYLPDHEPALGSRRYLEAPEWTSGFELAAGADLLIHDAQYKDDEYVEHTGWGHSSLSQALAFAASAGVKHLVTFHHDPSHDDATINAMIDKVGEPANASFAIEAGSEGSTWEL